MKPSSSSTSLSARPGIENQKFGCSACHSFYGDLRFTSSSSITVERKEAALEIRGICHCEDVEWSPADKPDQPLETPDWKTKDLRSMQMVKFRLGKDGHFLEMQLPLLVNGKPVY